MPLHTPESSGHEHFARKAYTRAARSLHRGGVYGKVLDSVGEAVITGVISEGQVLDTEQIAKDLGASRSVMREVLRTLESMGLIDSRPRRGTRVLPCTEWDYLNPLLIGWRGRSQQWRTQQLELLELRLGVEPEAAYLAVQRSDIGQEALHYAEAMNDALATDDIRGYCVADAYFHRIILEGSGNAAIAQFGEVVAAVLLSREFEHRPPERKAVMPEAAQRHIALALAIIDNEADRARQGAREIVANTIAELRSI